MNTERTRKAFAEMAIGLMVCGAVHMFLIAPQNARLARLQAEVDSIATAPGAAPALSAEQLDRLTRSAAEWADEVTRLSDAAQSETRLFTEIMTLAERSGVRIDQLQPTGQPAGHAAAPPEQHAAAAPDAAQPASAEPVPPKQGAVGYTMVVSSSYVELIGFLAALPRQIGFTVVRSVRLEPLEASDRGTATDLVRAEVQTEHYWFDATQLRTLAVMGPNPGADPAIPASR